MYMVFTQMYQYKTPCTYTGLEIIALQSVKDFQYVCIGHFVPVDFA